MKKFKLKRVKWLNVIEVIILLLCIGIVARDFYILTIKSCITGNLATMTWIGLITEIILWIIIAFIYEDIKEKMSATHNN